MTTKNVSKTKQNKSSNSVHCLKCGKLQARSSANFYKSPDGFFTFNENYYPICKSCIAEMVEPIDGGYDYDMEKVFDILQKMNKVFLSSVWKSAKEESIKNREKGKNGWSQFNCYMKTSASMPQYRGLTWKDSDHFKTGATIAHRNNTENIKKHENINEDLECSTNNSSNILDVNLVRKWGNGYSHEEYLRLEDFYDDMKRSYEIETAAHVDYLKKICKVSLKMEQAIDDDKVDDFKKLSDVYDKLMHSAKFTAVQRSAADRTGGLNTFSEFFEYIEKEGFIPKFHTDEPIDIVDNTLENLKNFTKRLVLGDSSINSLVEETLKKMKDKEEIEEDQDINEDEDIYMDLTDEEDGVENG